MNIKTTRFGEIEINDDKIIEFEQGIPGFDEEKQFVIIPYDTLRIVRTAIRSAAPVSTPRSIPAT